MPGQATEQRDAPYGVAEELVATKLVPPRVRDGYIPRKRLIDALAAGRDRRLTLVDAPTGYGKTMLVAAWCAELSEQDERGIENVIGSCHATIVPSAGGLHIGVRVDPASPSKVASSKVDLLSSCFKKLWPSTHPIAVLT